MSDTKEFVIENGVLEKYTGPGGAAAIPDSVTAILWGAFEGCGGLTIYASAVSYAKTYAKKRNIHFVAE